MIDKKENEFYLIEMGECRGESFSSEDVIDKDELIEIMEKYDEIVFDGMCDMEDNGEFDDIKSLVRDVVFCGELVSGDEYLDNKKKKIEMLKSGESINICLEESNIYVLNNKEELCDWILKG